MTTRTKLAISVNTAGAMMLLNVFSKPLHIPEVFQWALIVGVFVPLGFAFYFIKQQKLEKQRQPAAPEDVRLKQQQTARKWLILSMILGSAVGLCSPFWMPLTGTTLGFRGDLICGIITTVIVWSILGFRLGKVGRSS